MQERPVQFQRVSLALDGIRVDEPGFRELCRIARRGIRFLPNVGRSLKFQTYYLLEGRADEKDLYQDPLGNVKRR